MIVLRICKSVKDAPKLNFVVQKAALSKINGLSWTSNRLFYPQFNEFYSDFNLKNFEKRDKAEKMHPSLTLWSKKQH